MDEDRSAIVSPKVGFHHDSFVGFILVSVHVKSDVSCRHNYLEFRQELRIDNDARHGIVIACGLLVKD
jgi:hypothetical protein